MNSQDVRILLEKYRAGTLSDEDRAILEGWYLNEAKNEDEYINDAELLGNLKLVEMKLMAQTKPSGMLLVKRLSVAAAVIVLTSVCVLSLHWYRGELRAEKSMEIRDLPPGGNKAVLTLANGKKIDLNDQKNTIVVIDREIRYSDGSVLTDKQLKKSNHNSRVPLLNSLNTPKGGQYKVVLPDGTRVWLNAASILRYPVEFASDKRLVYLEGEAYFEVNCGMPADNNKRPFIVKTKDQEVRVIGTNFNVEAYTDDNFTVTTLVNGKVKVVPDRDGKELSLEPGQESILSSDILKTRQADVPSVIGWKEGVFRFNESGIQDVMKQLSRWYNMEVTYEGVVPQAYFYGVIKRDRPLTAVLDVLKEGGVHFKIERTGNVNRLVVLSQ